MTRVLIIYMYLIIMLKCIFQVHFANEEDLVVIHPETAEWCQAYEEARIGPWVQFAADRERFKKRITDSETVLNPILSNDHREKVYSDRFCED